MDETIDILDAEGKLTARTCLKSEAHRNGWCHRTIHVWLYTADGRVVLQQRGAQKKTFPNLWDVSAAGHVGAGEDILEAAVREVYEELGCIISAEKLEKIGVFKEVHHHGPEFIDCEFHHTFIAPLEVPFSSLVAEEQEVAQLGLKHYIQVGEEAWGKANPSVYVPHSSEYYRKVFRAIKNRL